eukprot:1196212-Prorocentrum_minimum.AAC.2
MRGQALLHACIRLNAQARAHVRTKLTGYATRYVCAGVQTRSAQCFARTLYCVFPPYKNKYERSGAITCVHTSGCTERAHISTLHQSTVALQRDVVGRPPVAARRSNIYST